MAFKSNVLGCQRECKQMLTLNKGGARMLENYIKAFEAKREKKRYIDMRLKELAREVK